MDCAGTSRKQLEDIDEIRADIGGATRAVRKLLPNYTSFVEQ